MCVWVRYLYSWHQTTVLHECLGRLVNLSGLVGGVRKHVVRVVVVCHLLAVVVGALILWVVLDVGSHVRLDYLLDSWQRHELGREHMGLVLGVLHGRGAQTVDGRFEL